MTLKDLETRIERLVQQCQDALQRATRRGGSTPEMEIEDCTALRAARLAFIEGTFGREHSYYTEFEQKVTTSWASDGRQALGILNAIRDLIKGGWIETTKGIVTREVFADFLEMAEHLLEEKYKDPAAVITGSVLEGHLRQLCIAASLPVEDSLHGNPKKADALNVDLAKAGRYDKLDQKQVTAWLDLRNRAAHGNYSGYTDQQVALMLAGVRDFISRNRP